MEKKVGSPSSLGRKRPFISLNSSASIENLSSSERTRVRARANHAKNDAQKGCAMQLNGITLSLLKSKLDYTICVFVVLFAPSHFPAGFYAQNSVDYRSNLGRQQNYLLFKLLRVIYLA